MLSVVIPTFNHSSLLRDCLAWLVPQLPKDSEVIVVDDASTEDIAAALAEDFAMVRVVRLNRNRGFAVAANTGIRATTGEWVLLLNNDVTLAPDCIARMMVAVKENEADMAAPLLLWRDDPTTIYSAGDQICLDGRPEAIGFRTPREGFDFTASPFGVTAACGLYHRRVFETVGLLEESFVAYFEDADLSFRARLAGFRAIVVPEAVAWHVGSASIQQNTWWRSAQCYRNHALLVVRCFPWSLLLRNLDAITHERAHQRGMMFSSARAHGGALMATLVTLRYMAWLAVSLPQAILQRRRIQRCRSITNDDLMQLLSEIKK